MHRQGLRSQRSPAALTSGFIDINAMALNAAVRGSIFADPEACFVMMMTLPLESTRALCGDFRVQGKSGHAPDWLSVPSLCRFLGRLHDTALHAHRRQASEKRQGTKSRLVGSGGAAGSMGIWLQEGSLGWCVGEPGLDGGVVQRVV